MSDNHALTRFATTRIVLKSINIHVDVTTTCVEAEYVAEIDVGHK